jgi:hypothetical protein
MTLEYFQEISLIIDVLLQRLLRDCTAGSVLVDSVHLVERKVAVIYFVDIGCSTYALPKVVKSAWLVFYG